MCIRDRFQYEEGGYQVTRGCAWTGPGCHLGCGVIMYQDADGKLAKCEGCLLYTSRCV